MERPEQTHHLMPKSHEYSALHPNDSLEDDDDAAAAGSEPTPTRRQSFWRNRPWWQWLVLLQLVNILVFLVLENRKGIAHRIAKARDPIASSCKRIPHSSIPSLTILINHTPRSRPIHQERRRRIPRHQRRLLDAPPKPNLLEMDAPPKKRHRNAPQQTPPSSRPNTRQAPHHSPLTTSGNRKPQPLPSRRLPQSPLPRNDPQTPS